MVKHQQPTKHSPSIISTLIIKITILGAAREERTPFTHYSIHRLTNDKQRSRYNLKASYLIIIKSNVSGQVWWSGLSLCRVKLELWQSTLSVLSVLLTSTENFLSLVLWPPVQEIIQWSLGRKADAVKKLPLIQRMKYRLIFNASIGDRPFIK